MLSIAESDLLRTQVNTRFVVNASGRLLHENDPVRTAAPRLYLAGCKQGNLLRLRQDVDDETARALEALAASEPPLSEPDSLPIHLHGYVEQLRCLVPVECWDAGLTWTFSGDFAYRPAAALVCSGRADGDALLRLLSARGLPQGLRALGFEKIDDFWAPWCAVIYEGEIASVAFCARHSGVAAEAGVVTVAGLRGRGYATAATAGWAHMPELRGHRLFYSTRRANAASRRVAERLGLRFLGASLSIT